MNTSRTFNRNQESRTTERGSATLVMIALLAIMLILILANSRTLFNLQRELKLIERQQIERLNTNHGHSTNAVGTSSTENHQSP
jgi:hypothetical protein